MFQTETEIPYSFLSVLQNEILHVFHVDFSQFNFWIVSPSECRDLFVQDRVEIVVKLDGIFVHEKTKETLV